MSKDRPDPFANAERVRGIAEEYRIAYQQLQHAEARLARTVEEGERDCDLARTRYGAARAGFLALALGEEDEFVEEADGDLDVTPKLAARG